MHFRLIRYYKIVTFGVYRMLLSRQILFVSQFKISQPYFYRFPRKGQLMSLPESFFQYMYSSLCKFSSKCTPLPVFQYTHSSIRFKYMYLSFQVHLYVHVLSYSSTCTRLHYKYSCFWVVNLLSIFICISTRTRKMNLQVHFESICT